MQHTDKYQLNLIETSDTFSPAPLNENAHKLEAALEAVRAEAAAGDAALDTRVTVLEQPRIACGKFIGKGTSGSIRDFPLPFQPEAVIVFRFINTVSYMSSYLFIASEGMTLLGGIIPDGFRLICTTGSPIMDCPNVTYYYLALG